MYDGQQEVRMTESLERAVEGDATAFAEIVGEHQAMVFSIALHYLQDRSLAEDVAQEVFLELYQNLSVIESPLHLKYWLRRVAVHRCIDQGRRRNYRRETPLDGLPEPATEIGMADPALLGRLRQTLEALPEKQRMVVILRYQEDLGPAEIAELLRMPVNTVKSTLHRSVEELRRKLTRKLGEVRYAIF
ncbi:MAG: RNA polymerase sigma factor [Actinomycetota bacterium]